MTIPPSRPDGPATVPAARLTAELARAVAGGGLMLHFQPRFCLRSRLAAGAEALARWPHRRRGMIAPGEFIPLAEESGAIVPLGAWALEAACAEAARWPTGVVSVNVSAAQLAAGVLLDQVEHALERSRLPAERLELELTESMLADAGLDTLLMLSAVRDLGIGLALDDFGTGYASLAMLKRLPLTAMKLDRSLVRGLLRVPEDTAVVRAAVAVGHALGLLVVAEGLLNEAQARALEALGCQEGQSFFLGKPMGGERMRALLEAQEGGQGGQRDDHAGGGPDARPGAPPGCPSELPGATAPLAAVG